MLGMAHFYKHKLGWFTFWFSFVKRAIPDLCFFFKLQQYNLYDKNVKKYLSSTRCWDSNSHPLGNEHPATTTRAGLPPIFVNFYIFIFNKATNLTCFLRVPNYCCWRCCCCPPDNKPVWNCEKIQVTSFVVLFATLYWTFQQKLNQPNANFWALTVKHILEMIFLFTFPASFNFDFVFSTIYGKWMCQT